MTLTSLKGLKIAYRVTNDVYNFSNENRNIIAGKALSIFKWPGIISLITPIFVHEQDISESNAVSFAERMITL